MTKNKMTDLPDHLFAELERLGDEGLSPEELDAEIQRARAIANIASRIIENAGVPSSSMIVFAGRNQRNFDPDNLVCIARKELAYHDRDSLEAAALTARMIQEARGKELRERTCKTCGRPYKPCYTDQRRCQECIAERKEARR